VRTVLLVDDEPGVRTALGIALRRGGMAVEEAGSLDEARRRCETRSHDAVVADYRLGDGTGLDLLRWLRGRRPLTPFVMITAYGTVPLTVSAMRDGATHVLAKPVEPDALIGVLEGATRRPEADALPSWIVARSAAMRACLDAARAAAPARGAVLITGPTGAGKEVVARFIHESGDRRGGPFVALNGAAVTPALFESEFFGHVRGAFTGAVEDRPGVFGEADGGTLLLDEVVEVPAALQPKLLRAVETGEYRPVGSSRTLRSSARVIAATNADPRSGRLREDLYYRLAVFRISVAPLASRPEDVVPLAGRFVAECARLYGREAPSLDGGAIAALRAHPWPGNVRELRNAVERAVASTRGAVITAAALDLQRAVGAARDLESVERAHILRVLEECEGNRTEAARRLGIGKSTLQRRLKKYGSE